MLVLHSLIIIYLMSNPASNITCADRFYLTNNSVCHPLCGSWVEWFTDVCDVPFVKWMAAAFATLTICLLVLVFFIALAFQRSEMYVFILHKKLMQARGRRFRQ